MPANSKHSCSRSSGKRHRGVSEDELEGLVGEEDIFKTLRKTEGNAKKSHLCLHGLCTPSVSLWVFLDTAVNAYVHAPYVPFVLCKI